MPTQGLWNIAGINLPDFGISEKLGIGPNNAAISAPQMSTWNQYSQPLPNTTTVAPSYSGTTYSGPVYSGPVQTVTKPATTTTSSPTPTPSQPSSSYDPNAEYQRQLEEARRQQEASINNQYNSYFTSLDSQLSGLSDQRSNQEQILSNSYNTTKGSLDSQRGMGLSDLAREESKVDESQVRTLRDLAGNLRNQYMAGSIYLGARGAGDSSAANQYSYALNKLGNRERGNIQNQANDMRSQIADKRFKVNEIYNSEVNKLTTDRDNKMLQIAQWFADSQNQIRQMKANGEISRETDMRQLSTNLLNQSLSLLNQVQNEAVNRRSMLESWAASNSRNANELNANMAAISQYQAMNPNWNPINVTPTGTKTPSQALFGFGTNQDDWFRNLYR